MVMPTAGALAPPPGAPEEAEFHPLSLKEEMVRDRFERFEDRLFRLREQLAEREPDNASRLRRVLERAGELGLADQLDELIELLKDPSSLDAALNEQAEWLEGADRLLAVLLERDSHNDERKDEMERLQKYYEKLDRILEQEQGLRERTAQTGLTGRLVEQLDQAIRRLNALRDRQAEVSRQTQPQGGEPPLLSGPLEKHQSALSRDAAQLADDLKRLGEQPSQESADSPSLESARKDISAAAAATKNGAKSMSGAEKALQAGDANKAGRDQQEALAALRAAKERLEEAKRRLAQETDAQALAEKQEQIAKATGDLSDQMKQDAAAGGGKGSQGGSPSSSKTPPGQQSLNQAEQEMNDAAQSLGQQKPEDATKSEDRAIEELQQARNELEQALSQLRQEEKEETLRDLESRFREMLAKQRGINETTVQLAGLNEERFDRAQRLQMAELAAQQRALSQDAASCLHILDEDGTTVVFPRLVEQISKDMGTVADRLATFQVGMRTQSIERDIVEALEQLLEAVQQMQQENQQQSMPMAGEPGQSPLVPPSAELKLLRASQVRINTRTAAIESARVTHAEPDEVLGPALRAVAARQVETAEMARELRDRQNQP